MARGVSNKLYRNFTKGLITEASMLTYPENACVDLDNCVLYRKGNLSRRLGFDFEPSSTLTNASVLNADIDNLAYKEFVWEAVGNDTSRNYLVVQTGTNVNFYDLNNTPLSDSQQLFFVNMANFIAPNAMMADAQLCEMHFASGKGYLFIVGEKFEPVIISFNKGDNTITVEKTNIIIRDFVGVNDGLPNDHEPATLSVEHNYNLLNQGWVNPENEAAGDDQLTYDSFGNAVVQGSPGQSPIDDFFVSRSRYPGNNKQWWVARDSTTNAFKPELLDTFFYGASRAPRGHFLFNAFYQDRSAVSGLPGLPVTSTDQRPTANTFFSGRACYVAESSFYYSQILDDKSKAGMCFQEADPTSEAVSDLIASDGGVIPIPEMGKALRMFPAAGGVLIFANNGVWFVGGGSSGFSALDVSVTKVSSIGTDSPNSIVDTKRGIFYFDRVGIRMLVVESSRNGPTFELTTPSEETIQTFIQDGIPAENRKYIKGVYDPHTNVVQWLFNSQPNNLKYVYDRVLTLDMTLGSFYPYTITDSTARIVGLFPTKVVNPIDNPFRSSIRETAIKFRVMVPGSDRWNFRFGYFKDYTFKDWGVHDGGHSYMSFIESGYELLDDAMRKKEMNYIFTYFRRTEENWVADVPDNPSSCYFQVKWDWSSSQVSNQWTNKVQAYRHNRLPLYDGPDAPFDTGYPIVVAKNKVRGHGRAIQFRFESDGIGRDFDLLGWAVPYSGNTSP